ncbi:MAG: UvrD-helicase domain-containing protein [Oscillospiraceae bacterium]|jgi:DNA helicase-2/ATP-dependent DNA helicase PcrA|nr:UvrD-helicase domain-containing protein [Oscillospiraceae bacterium]
MQKYTHELELQKLKETKDFIYKEMLRLQTLRRDSRERAMSIGKKYAEDNPYGAVYGENLTAHQDTVQRELDAYEQSEIDIRMLEKLLLGPYFARVDFRIAENGTQNSFYIGLKNLYDKDAHKSLVSDWRAPVGELFYNDFEGQAFYEAPMGTLSGDILLKRQFKFENGTLKYFFDSSLKINDEILGEALAEDSKDRLKVIVSSIQREQNAAIRFSDTENLAVFGPAGSGKTSIGLHRVAYLLYKNRKSLSSKDVLLFTSSNVFATYIADIIPELGEQDILKKDFFDVVAQNIRADYTVYDYYEQANNLLSGGGAVRSRAVRLKYSDVFLDFLRGFVGSRAFGFQDIIVQGKTVLTKETIRGRFESDREEYNLTQKTERIVSFCINEIDAFFHQNEPFIRAKIEEEREVFDDPNQLYRMLKRETKQKTRSRLHESLRVDEIAIYHKALSAYCEESGNAEVFRQTKRNLNRRMLFFEDALVVLYIRALLGTLQKIKEPKHVLIDEAQDFCPLQHKIIRYLCPTSRFTLLADTNQGILNDVNTLSKEQLCALYDANMLQLKKSYRSTRHINETALMLLGGERYEIFDREGEPVSVETATDQVQAILTLLRSGRLRGKSTCIVTKTTASARRLFEALRQHEKSIRLIDDRSEEFGAGVMVMPLVLTKGLEFDNVIIPFADALCSKEKENRILYLMVTRALHRLFVLFEDQPLFPFD